MKKKLEILLPLLAGTFIFMIFALYNKYPIASGDAATYLDSGFNLFVPGDRPIFYGLFLHAASLGHTIWGPVLVQCLILSYLCTRFIRSILPGLPDLRVLGILLFVSLGTIAGWYAGQIGPDTFTPILFLGLYLYLRAENTTAEKILLLAIIYLAVVVHYSHYMIASVFVLVLLLAGWLHRDGFRDMRKKCFRLLGLILFCWLSLFSSNFISGKGFTSSSSSHVFLMGKLAESGMLKKYLDDACPVKQYKICAYKDNLPPVAWEFVWSDKSPVALTGGWEANRQEYRTILRAIISTPRYWPRMAYKSLGATMRQVVLGNIDESEEAQWSRYGKDHPLYQQLERHFPGEINDFATSRQNNKSLGIVFYDEVYVIVLLLTSFCCLMLLHGDLKKQAANVYVLLFLYLLANAFATATFANVLTRLNSRDIWLLPMTNMVFIYASLRNLLRHRLDDNNATGRKG